MHVYAQVNQYELLQYAIQARVTSIHCAHLNNHKLAQEKKYQLLIVWEDELHPKKF